MRSLAGFQTSSSVVRFPSIRVATRNPSCSSRVVRALVLCAARHARNDGPTDRNVVRNTSCGIGFVSRHSRKAATSACTKSATGSVLLACSSGTGAGATTPSMRPSSNAGSMRSPAGSGTGAGCCCGPSMRPSSNAGSMLSPAGFQMSSFVSPLPSGRRVKKKPSCAMRLRISLALPMRRNMSKDAPVDRKSTVGDRWRHSRRASTSVRMKYSAGSVTSLCIALTAVWRDESRSRNICSPSSCVVVAVADRVQSMMSALDVSSRLIAPLLLLCEEDAMVRLPRGEGEGRAKLALKCEREWTRRSEL